MDLLDRLLGHDEWTTRQLLLLCCDMTDEQLDRPLDIGHRTVRVTFLHLIRNIEIWSQLMVGNVEQARRQPQGRTVPEMIKRLDQAAADLANVARSVADRGAWDEQWLDALDNPPARKTYGGAIAHIITHSMHHRAQLLYMLRLLGVANLPEGDVMSWEAQALAK